MRAPTEDLRLIPNRVEAPDPPQPRLRWREEIASAGRDVRTRTHSHEVAA